MDALAPAPERGWASAHPKTIGWLILLGLHAVFVLGPTGLLFLVPSSGSGGLPNLMWLPDWTGLKHEAVSLWIGIVQFYYVIPAILLALKLHYPAVAKGILHGALATFLLNLSACGLFLWQLSKIEG